MYCGGFGSLNNFLSLPVNSQRMPNRGGGKNGGNKWCGGSRQSQSQQRLLEQEEE